MRVRCPPVRPQNPSSRHHEQGASLLLMVLISTLLFLGLYSLFGQFFSANIRNEQSAAAAATLAQAKAALIGYAATYSDTHPGELIGYLPCPDTNNDGKYTITDSCGSKDVSVIGRLPWKTLALPPMHDGDNECLWYAVSGRAKNNGANKSDLYNWDTPGQFIIQTAGGEWLAGATPHSRPLAVIFTAGHPLAGQNRAGGNGECAGSPSDAVAAYLEGIGTLSTGNTIITLADAASLNKGSNNDHALWINSAEIFDLIKKRSDFKAEVDTLLNNVANYLNSLPATALPAATTHKGLGDPIAGTAGSVAKAYLNTKIPDYQKRLFTRWSSNLLYAKPTGPAAINGESGCNALLVFSGERLPQQQRDPTAPATDTITLTNYLESPLLDIFGTSGDYQAMSDYAVNKPSADLIRCIKGAPQQGTHISFVTDFANFITSGASGAATRNEDELTLEFRDTSGTAGGCVWYANPIPLAGHSIRSYYNFKFSNTDDPNTAPDLRYGFTLQMIRDDLGVPLGCGARVDSGILTPQASSTAPGIWGSRSFIIETDIFRNSNYHDPVGNHTAIMKNCNLDHATFGSLSTTDCKGLSNLCEHAPIDNFEESPFPRPHNQRMEITSGCTPDCKNCVPAQHAAPNTFVRLAVWIDCTDCADINVAMNRAAIAPSIEICSNLSPADETAMDQIYVGFTSGFSPSYANPVSIHDFVLRSE